MRLSINAFLLAVSLIIPFSCSSQQSERHGLTKDHYSLYTNGLRKAKREPKEAIVLLDSLLKIKPDFCRALAPYGLAYYSLGNFARAKKSYQNLIQCEHTSPFGYHELSRIYQEQGEYDSAELILLKWLDYEKYDLDSLRTEYKELGEITRAKNQYYKSLEYLTEAINRCNEVMEYKYCRNLFYLRADSYSIIGEPEKAWEDILVHEQLNPEDRASLVLKGEILQLLGKYQESTKILKDYLINPTNLGENWVNFMIGVNYHHLNESEKSCLHLREAARLGYEDEKLDELLNNCDQE